MKRYEQYAHEITTLIKSQTLRPGERLPSVRRASASRKICPSTVFEAYYLLEARGLIQARPRSGYYVSALVKPAYNVFCSAASCQHQDRSSNFIFSQIAQDFKTVFLGKQNIKQDEVVHFSPGTLLAGLSISGGLNFITLCF